MGAKQRNTITFPVKTGTGIGLAARCDIGMPGNMRDGISLLQRLSDHYQRRILNVGKRRGVAALKLDTDGKIVTAGPALPAGFSSVPGTLFARNKLDDLAIAADEEMSGNLEIMESIVIGVRFRIELVGEQLYHAITAKLIRWQADIMDHQQIYGASNGTIVAIG